MPFLHIGRTEKGQGGGTNYGDCPWARAVEDLIQATLHPSSVWHTEDSPGTSSWEENVGSGPLRLAPS